MSRRSKAAIALDRQPDLFAFDVGPGVASRAQRPAWSPVEGQVSTVDMAPKPKSVFVPESKSTGSTRARASIAHDTRVVAVDDLPAYAVLDQELVDRSIAALPPGRMWFTYSAIRECFGVSRATVARKVKKGLVPGIRFRGARVLEDGPVRRFDRNQLRWLLLAVRAHH